jgi:hypothetical protein
MLSFPWRSCFPYFVVYITKTILAHLGITVFAFLQQHLHSCNSVCFPIKTFVTFINGVSANSIIFKFNVKPFEQIFFFSQNCNEGLAGALAVILSHKSFYKHVCNWGIHQTIQKNSVGFIPWDEIIEEKTDSRYYFTPPPQKPTVFRCFPTEKIPRNFSVKFVWFLQLTWVFYP